MRKIVAMMLASSLGASVPMVALAATADLAFSGNGISANIELTYGAVTDSKVRQGFVITAASGTFSDSTIGISDASIRGLVAINNATPDSTNLLAPDDFSRFTVAEGLSPDSHGYLTYDNLYYPAGSPPTATDYPAAGGALDIYGLMFRIGDGRIVDLWSNGIFGPPGSAPIQYGAAVATLDAALDYVGGGVSAVPEPVNGALFLSGLCALGLLWRRQPS